MIDDAQLDRMFDEGRGAEAMALLGEAARRGDAFSLEWLATAALTGRYVHRDLALARDLFSRAAAAGSTTAAATTRAFLASGTGGPRDWPGALALTRAAAATDPSAAADMALLGAMALDDAGNPTRLPAPKRLSDRPDVRLHPGLFSTDEIDFLRRRAAPMFAPSVIVDPDSGAMRPDPIRTSHVAAFPRMAESPAIHALNRRLAAASDTDADQGEPLQVLRYAPGQRYGAHLDALPGADNQRVLTFLVWLNDDYEGGETVFLPDGPQLRGAPGDGLLFANVDADGLPDAASRHAGQPVTAGEKYLASRWIRARPVLGG